MVDRLVYRFRLGKHWGLCIHLLQVVRIRWKHNTGPSALSYAVSIS
jgi:hypothetical protein